MGILSNSINNYVNNVGGNSLGAIGTSADKFIKGQKDYGVLSQSIDDYVKSPMTKNSGLKKFAQALSSLKDDKGSSAPAGYEFTPSMVDYSQYINNNPYIQRMRGY